MNQGENAEMQNKAYKHLHELHKQAKFSVKGWK
jgi:hypothetical protein